MKSIQAKLNCLFVCLLSTWLVATVPASAQLTLMHESIERASRVESLGDIDGDAFPDYLIADYNAGCEAGANCGIVTVISGGTGLAVGHVTGNARESLGSSLAGLGDTNYDGIPDFAAAASVVEGNSVVGSQVKIFSGADLALLHAIQDFDVLNGFGNQIKAAGDVNSDGAQDIVISIPGAQSTNSYAQVFRYGAVAVYSGSDASLIHHWVGKIPFGVFGASIDGNLHLDIDLVPDILVTDLGAGDIHAFSGATGRRLFRLETGFPVGANPWLEIAAIGDLNGDLLDEFAVAVAQQNRLFVFNGVNQNEIVEINNEAAGFGIDVIGIGDVNGNDEGDFMVSGVGKTWTYDGHDFSLIKLLEFGSFSPVGDSMNSAGDVNRDGFADVVIAGGNGINKAFLYVGNTGFDLYVTPNVRAGEAVTLRVTGAPANHSIHIYSGRDIGTADVPGCPGVPLGLRNPSLRLTLTTDGQGEAEIQSTVPLNVTGQRFVMKAVDQTDCGTALVSNGHVHQF